MAPERAGRSFVKRLNFAGWLFVVLVAVLAEAVVRLFDLHDSVAAPSAALRALVDGLSSGALSGPLGTTLEAYAVGLALAAVGGVALGVIIGSSRTLLDASSVLLEFLRPIPAVALIPVAILFFGLDTPMRRFVVAYAAVWPILIHTIYGVRGSDRLLEDVARTSGVTGVGRLVRVTVPAALPSIATGIRLSASIALVVCVTAEFVTPTGRNRCVHAAATARVPASRAVLGGPPDGRAWLRDQPRAPRCRTARRVLGRRGADGRPVVVAALPQVGRKLLGVAVFLAAVGIWEVWARYEASFLIPPASEVAKAAWEDWPTAEFLTEVAASLKRLAAGPCSAQASGSSSGC